MSGTHRSYATRHGDHWDVGCDTRGCQFSAVNLTWGRAVEVRAQHAELRLMPEPEPEPEPEDTYEEWLSGRIGDGRVGLGDVLIRFGEWLDREGLIYRHDPGSAATRTFDELTDQFLDEEREREWEQG